MVVSECEFDEIIDENHNHRDVFDALVVSHLKGKEKLDCGISHFVFVVGDFFKEKQLRIVRTDGSVETMSYNFSHIISRTTASQKQVLALRESIYDQILEYRAGLPETTACLYCGATDKGIHVDHIFPFSAIATDYISSIGDVPLEFVKNSIKRTYEFADPNEKMKWQNYHKQTAKFQPLCPMCNIKKGAKII